MTVFEKIKKMNIDELAKFLDAIQRDFDCIDNFYCGYVCNKYMQDECLYYPESCALNRDPLLACKEFLNSDYDMIRSLKYGKE